MQSIAPVADHSKHKSVPAAWWADQLGMRQRKDPTKLSVRTLARWRKDGVGPPYTPSPVTKFIGVSKKNGQERKCVKSPRNQTDYCHPDFCLEAAAWRTRYRKTGRP